MPIINGRYVRHEPDPVDYAAQEIGQAMLDIEIAIRRSGSHSDLLALYLKVATLTSRAIALEKLALDRADAWRV